MISSHDASVLVIGAGGLGSPALLSLAARGVKRIGVLEPDCIELSNLHRQILYTESDVGEPKAACARRALLARWPDLEIELFPAAFSRETHDLISRFDIVLDGTDQFETKLAISDACVDRGVPYVFAGVVGYEGQVLAVRPGESACLRCFFDEAPPPGDAPTCADLGILGPIAGIVAARQVEMALAAIRGDSDAFDRLWLYDGRLDRARVVPLKKAADCRGCGSRKDHRGSALDDAAIAELGDAPVIDLSGYVCPATYTETRRVLERLPERGRVWIHLTSDEAARNVPKSALAAGHRVLARRSDGRTHQVLLERGATDGDGSEERVRG